MRVMVFGTFDGLHPGHRYLLDIASERSKPTAQSPQLFVVVARDANVVRFKSRASVQSEDERLQAIRDAYPQAEVMLGDPENFLSPVHAVKPDLIILGYDQKLPPGVSQDDLGAPVERLDAFEPEKYKSSLLRGKVQ